MSDSLHLRFDDLVGAALVDQVIEDEVARASEAPAVFGQPQTEVPVLLVPSLLATNLGLAVDDTAA